MKTIRQLLDAAYETRYDQPYIHTKDEVHTFGETVARVRTIAASLTERGLAQAHIAVWGENSYAWMLTDLAVMGYVGVTVALDRNLKVEAVVRAVQSADVRCVIYSQAKEADISIVREQCKEILFLPMESLAALPIDDNAPLPADKDPDACSKIVFSSGTTAEPKAVMLSQRNMFSGFDLLMRRAPMSEEDLCYLFLPLHHTYAGLCNFLYSIRSGMQIYLCSDLQKMTEELVQVRPTVLSAVPLILERIWRALPAAITQAEELSEEQCALVQGCFGGRLKYLFCGGAKLDPQIKRFFHRAGVNLLEAYALTETASIFSIEYSGSRNADSVGTVFEFLDIRVEEPDADGVGELLVRGENVFSGYYGNEAATAAAFDSEGYFRTGDLGFVAADGNLYLRGRKRRMILRSNGENVYPDELESKLCSLCSAVSRAKVYEKDGMIRAVLYCEGAVNGEELMDRLNSSLPAYSRVEAWELIADEIGARMK